MMTKKARYLLLLLIFINGYISLSLELISLRQVSGFVGSTAVTASIIIGIFLAFMSVGYYKGSTMKLIKINTKELLYVSFVVSAFMIIGACSFILVAQYFETMESLGIKSNITKTFIYSFLWLSISPFLFGLNTAIICRYLHRYNINYTGRIMAIDTIGSVLGSLLTTLLLMPFMGVNHTIVLVVFIAIWGAVAIKPNVKSFILLVSVTAITYLINSNALLYKEFSIIENNAVSTISILSTDNGKSKVMIMNNATSSKYSEDRDLNFPYIKYIDNNFINTMPKDDKKDILVLGAGGFTVGDLDEYNNYIFIDIDQSLLKISEEHFLNKKLSANKKFIVQDAGQFLSNSEKKYDLIILDVYSTLEFMPQDLITKEFFQKVKDNLKKDGIVAMNIVASPNFNTAFSRKIDNTIRNVFGNNIQRQVMSNFNAWNYENSRITNVNILYIYYNRKNDGDIYTNNKNSVVYDM